MTMNEADNFALVPRPPGALEKAEPGAKRILSGMVADTLALAKKVSPQKARPLRIVIADDEPEYCEMVEAAIRNWLKEVTVITIHDGLEAWHELMREDPDFLIMDQNHPGLDGLEMLGRLAERKVKYPIMVASGMAEEKDLRQCAGPDLKFTFFPKPFTREEFLREVSIILGPGDNPQPQVSLKTPRDTTTPVEVTPQPRKTRPSRIVILDDEEFLREAYSLMLKTWYDGVEIIGFGGARDAWQELSRTDPDLFITDIHHTWMSCQEMLARLAEKKVKYPILVISGGISMYGENARRGWGPGLNVSFLQKPVDNETFRTVVESALQIPARRAP